MNSVNCIDLTSPFLFRELEQVCLIGLGEIVFGAHAQRPLMHVRNSGMNFIIPFIRVLE